MKNFILVDPLISGYSGHFAELGAVILAAASEMGYSPTALTHKSFPVENDVFRNFEVQRVFSHQRANKWSLGPEGRSYCGRDIGGRPNCSHFAFRLVQSVIDKVRGPSPKRILRQTSEELLNTLKGISLNEEDVLIFQTCDDFLLLIVANAIARLEANRTLNLVFLWHTPYQKGREAEFPDGWRMLPELTRQIALCEAILHEHNVLFLSTTEEIKAILNGSIAKELWRHVSYPIRRDFRPLSKAQADPPYRVLLGGAQRAEKGKRDLPQALSTLWPGTLSTGKWELTLQVSSQDAKTLLPARLRKLIGAGTGSANPPVRLLDGSLDAASYLNLLRSSDVGLFLYRSRKYYARCSGVFVEMLACGLPVVVPSGSWLSRQLSPFVYQYLDTVDSQFSFEEELEHLVGKNISAVSTVQPHVSISVGPDSCIRVTPNIADAKAWSYVGVDIITELEDGQSIAETRVLELGCMKPARFVVGREQGRKSIRLRFFVPYGNVPLHLLSVFSSATKPGSMDVPRSSVGLVYNKLHDLPACFSELAMHMDHYLSSASQNSIAWRHQHSGPAFLKSWLSLLQAE